MLSGRKSSRTPKYDSTTRYSDLSWSERDTGSGSALSIDSVDCVSTKSDKTRYIATYNTKWGEKVVISEPLNPWQVLGFNSTDVSYRAIKKAFKMKITQSRRQNRAMVSIACHMLTSSGDRYTRKPGTDEYIVRKHDHFLLAACGHTVQLEFEIFKRANLVEDKDEYGRTLLYTASKSGFYDTCKMLLQKGASVDETQIDGSTPLHGAAYFGHAQVVRLLLQHGARTNLRNNWGNASLDESATSEIRRVIQTASVDQISSLAADLREKKLVLSVRVIEYRGEVIARELIRDPRALDARARMEWNTIHGTWKLAWHGTRFANLESIIRKGLLPASTGGINPEPGHFRLGEEHFGISNWAAAIFVPPAFFTHHTPAIRVESFPNPSNGASSSRSTVDQAIRNYMTQPFASTSRWKANLMHQNVVCLSLKLTRMSFCVSSPHATLSSDP